jgi:Uma2 family endonuclease
MDLMDRAGSPRSPEPSSVASDRDQIVVLRGIPWAQYDGLLRAREKVGGTRMAFLDGVLEIVSTSARHELYKTLIARLVEAYAEEADISLNGLGSTTYRKRIKQAGLEPDESYCIGPIRKFPHIALEIVQTSGGIDKLEIYRRLGVEEVWFWIDGRFRIYRLAADGYHKRARSVALPGIDLGRIQQIVLTVDDSRQTEAVRTYRRSLRQP